jgi:hypothetical protein
VAEGLGAAVVRADVVRRPALTELV